MAWTLGAAFAAGALAVGSGGLRTASHGGQRSGPPGAANLWVVADAGSCARSPTRVTFAESASSNARCGTLDQAYDAANRSPAASTILIRGGTYAWDGDVTNQVVTGSRSSSKLVTFDCADPPCTFQGIVQFGTGAEGPAGFASGPDYVALKNIRLSTFAEGAGPGHFQHGRNRFGVYLLGGTSHVRLENVVQGGFLMQGVRDIEYVGGRSGPCMAPSMDDFDPPGTVDHGNPCELNKIDWHTWAPEGNPEGQWYQPQRVLVEGVEFFDYAYTQECDDQTSVGADGCHHRSMYMNGVKDVTIRSSTFREHVYQPWMTISGLCDPSSGCSLGSTGAQTTGNEDVLIENNQFGASVFYNLGEYAGETYEGFVGGATCWAVSPPLTQPSYRDITIRFNSFAAYGALGVPGNIEGPQDAACTQSNYKIYGNIFGSKAVGAEACGNAGHAIQYRYNVYAGPVPGTCSGKREVNVGGTTMPWYAENASAPDPGDYALTGSRFPGDDLVPADDPEFPCPETDFTGRPRPSKAGDFCDAGAYER